jgi:Tfp pilus assembly protein PilO
MNISAQHYARDLGRYYRQPATQVSLALVLSLFIMAVFIIFALRPTLVAVTTLQKTIAESQTILQTLDAKVSNLQKASAQLEAIKPSLANLNSSIPNDGADYGTFSKTVEQLALQDGVTLDTGSLGPTLLYSRILTVFTPDKNQNVVTLPYTIRIIGSYPSVYTFLTQILMMQRVVSVDSVTITKQAESKTNTEAVAMDIGGNAYYLASDAQLKQALIVNKGTP